MSVKALAGAVGLVLASMTGAHAQQFQWSQVKDLPRGLNMPDGIKADVVGIEAGMNLDDARQILKKLQDEVPQSKRDAGDKSAPPWDETRTVFTLPTSPPQRIEFVSKIQLIRDLPGKAGDAMREVIVVHTSAPSSGNQVLSVERTIYYLQAEQPTRDDMMVALKEKYRAEPFVRNLSHQATADFAFGKGIALRLTESASAFCGNIINGYERGYGASDLISLPRKCDVTISAVMETGISDRHIKTLYVNLTDTQRAKENLVADYAFIDKYVKELQSKTKGVPPKL